MVINKKELFDKLQKDIVLEFPSAEVSLIDIHNISKSYTGLKVAFERDILTPVFDFDFIYSAVNEYCPFEKMSKRIRDEIKKAVVHHAFNLDILRNFDKLKDRLCIDVIPYESNRDFLKNIPYEQVNREAVSIVKAFIPNVAEKDRLYIVSIDENMLKDMGVSMDELFESAHRNSIALNPLEIFTVEDFIYGAQEYKACPSAAKHDNAKHPIKILGTRTGQCAGSILVSNEALKKLADIYKDDFYLVPSTLCALSLPVGYSMGKGDDRVGADVVVGAMSEGLRSWCEETKKHEIISETQVYDRNLDRLIPKEVYEDRKNRMSRERENRDVMREIGKLREEGRDLVR